jgi:hypothetical protein
MQRWYSSVIVSLASYVIGGIAGFLITLAIFMDPWQLEVFGGELLFELLKGDAINWAVSNLGHSVWAFLTCLGLFQFSLTRLKHDLDPAGPVPEYTQVVQADQLTDIWIHVFVGVGVIWTAIGMRSALVSTLGVADGLANDAGQVLGRLVDGGILLALSTTIVGAIGGYLMRLGKTIYLGAALAEYYQCHDARVLQGGLSQLVEIESLLAQLVAGTRHDET